MSAGNKLSSVPIADKILSVFKVAAERSNRKEPEFTRASFYEFLLRITIAQHKERDRRVAEGRSVANMKQLGLDNEITFHAIEGLFKLKEHGERSVVTND